MQSSEPKAIPRQAQRIIPSTTRLGNVAVLQPRAQQDACDRDEVSADLKERLLRSEAALNELRFEHARVVGLQQEEVLRLRQETHRAKEAAADYESENARLRQRLEVMAAELTSANAQDSDVQAVNFHLQRRLDEMKVQVAVQQQCKEKSDSRATTMVDELDSALPPATEDKDVLLQKVKVLQEERAARTPSPGPRRFRSQGASSSAAPASWRWGGAQADHAVQRGHPGDTETDRLLRDADQATKEAAKARERNKETFAKLRELTHTAHLAGQVLGAFKEEMLARQRATQQPGEDIHITYFVRRPAPAHAAALVVA